MFTGNCKDQVWVQMKLTKNETLKSVVISAINCLPRLADDAIFEDPSLSKCPDCVLVWVTTHPKRQTIALQQ